MKGQNACKLAVKALDNSLQTAFLVHCSSILKNTSTLCFFFFFFFFFDVVFEVFCSACGGFAVVLLFYVHGKHLKSCRDGQLT